MTLDELIDELITLRDSYPNMGKLPVEIDDFMDMEICFEILDSEGRPTHPSHHARYVILKAERS